MPAPHPIRVLIVDDEPLGVQRIVDLLRNEPDVEVVGTAEDGEEAIEAIARQAPDLVFLDVQMPGRTGLDVVQEVGSAKMPVTVFVTAYDQFALRAFDLAAVDYLVKPFDNERFAEAFRRARRRVELEGLEEVQAQIRSLLDSGTPPAAAPSDPAPPAREYLERIVVHTRGKLRVIPVTEVEYITASGAYAELHVGSARHLIRESLQALEDQLDPAHFFRVHRSAIVRLDLVETMRRMRGGDYQLQLRGGATVKVSRYRREALEQRLGRRR